MVGNSFMLSYLAISEIRDMEALSGYEYVKFKVRF